MSLMQLVKYILNLSKLTMKTRGAFLTSEYREMSMAESPLANYNNIIKYLTRYFKI